MHSRRKLGFARACTECHDKKIRCDLCDGKQICSNCQLYGVPCKLRPRKRKHDSVLRREPTSNRSPGRTVGAPAGSTLQQVDPSQGQREVNSLAFLAQHDLFTSTDRRVPTHDQLSLDPPARTPRSASGESASVSLDKGADLSPRTGSNQPPGSVWGGAQDTGHRQGGSWERSFIKGSIQNLSRDVSEPDIVPLHIYKAFDLPSRAWKNALLEKFFQCCHPWMPIVDRHWLEEDKDYTPSVTLLKAALLAGARITDAAVSCQEYYAAVKALILSGHEKNPIINIVAACLLGWWNQSPADAVSVDSSYTWLRYAIGIAYQIDLHKEPVAEAGGSYRRRLWWTLVARDSQLSAAKGKPRTVNLSYYTVTPLSSRDFPVQDGNSQLFIAYTKACITIGDLCEACLKGPLSHSTFIQIRNSLSWWIKELPPMLRKFSAASEPSDGNFSARQLHCLYLTTVSILYRTTESSTSISWASLLSSCLAVNLFESFLVRDEIRYLPPMYCFYAFVAAMPLITASRFSALESDSSHELHIIELALKALGKRWPSGESALRMQKKMRSDILQNVESSGGGKFTPPDEVDLLLIEDFSLSTCRHWHHLEHSSQSQNEVGLLHGVIEKTKDGHRRLSRPDVGSTDDSTFVSTSMQGQQLHASSVGSMGVGHPPGPPDQDLSMLEYPPGGWLLDSDEFDFDAFFNSGEIF